MEQANFDQLCSLVAAWARVEGPKRRQLIDSLCSSLTCLNAWIDKLLAVPPEAQNTDSVRQHRSAYKAYLFFLAWISGVAGREAAAAAPGSGGGDAASQLSQAVGGGRGRKKKAAAASGGVAGWDWGATFPKVVKAVAQALNTDLWALFRPSGPEEAVLIKAIQLVRHPARQKTTIAGLLAQSPLLCACCAVLPRCCLPGLPTGLIAGHHDVHTWQLHASDAAGHQRAGGPGQREVRGAGGQCGTRPGGGGAEIPTAGQCDRWAGRRRRASAQAPGCWHRQQDSARGSALPEGRAPCMCAEQRSPASAYWQRRRLQPPLGNIL